MDATIEPCAGGMPATTSIAGGETISDEVKDASEDAADTRAEHGLTAPGIPPKSPPKTARELERALRDELGFSKRQARAIAAAGFKGLADADPDPSDDVSSELAALLKRNLELIERQS